MRATLLCDSANDRAGLPLTRAELQRKGWGRQRRMRLDSVPPRPCTSGTGEKRWDGRGGDLVVGRHALPQLLFQRGLRGLLLGPLPRRPSHLAISALHTARPS